MSANYTPNLGEYTELTPFRYWCQKVMPLVYDDSLSYYELLCKLVDYLNKAMHDVDTLHTDVVQLHAAYVQLQQYVNKYFENLNIQTEIDRKLDEMAESGALLKIIKPSVIEEVNRWLTAHITNPSNPPIDKSLKVENAAADAKVTGDKIDSLKEDIDNRFENNLKLVDAVKWEKGSFSETDGTKATHNERARTSQKIKFSSNHIVCKMADDYGIIIYEYDENESFLKSYGVSYGYGSFEINVNRNNYYNFVSRKKNSDIFENLNIEANVRIFEYATIFKRADDDKFEYKSASSVFEALNKNLVPIYTECVEVGTIDNGIDTSNPNRLRTVGYIDIRNFDKIKIKNTSDESLGIQYAIFYNSQKEKIGAEIIEIGETDFDVSKYSYLRLLYGGHGYSTVKLFDTLSVFGYLQNDDIDNRFENNLKLVDAVKWEKGSFSETDGTKATHNERARTSQKIKFSSNHIVCKMADDYGIIIYEYDENESFLKSYGVSYGYGSFEINVNRNNYYNFVSRKKNSDIFENLNIEANVRIFEYATIFKRADDDKFEYKSASSVFEALNKNLVPIYTECVEVGTIDNGIDTSNPNRLRTVGYIDIRNFDKIKIKNTSDESLGIQYAIFYNSQKEKIGAEIIEIGETDFDVSKYSYLRLLYGGHGYSTVKLFDTLSVFGYLQNDDSTEIGKTDLNFELFKSTDAIPNEFNDELEKTATAVLADQNENTVSFAFITDLHFDYYLYNIQAPMVDSLYKCVKALSSEANLSFVAFGGDNTDNNWTDSGPSLSIQKQSTRYIRAEMLKNLRVPLLIATGNHDDNSIHCSSANGETLSKNNQENTGNRLITDVELYCYYAKHNENTKFVFGELGKNYGYLDLTDSKLRVFLLDSEDIPYTKNSNGFYTYTGQWTYAFRNAQLNFIANSLKFQDKDNPAEWKTIFIKHHSINPQYYADGDSYNFDVLLGILNAYQSGGTYKSSKSNGDFSYDVNVDYGGRKGTIIADIAGHLHNDVNGVYSGIPYVVTTTARYTERQDSLPTAMDIFTIDTKKRTVKVKRFGYGTDRSFTF